MVTPALGAATSTSLVSSGSVTANALVEKYTSFTPTTIGWYRIFTPASSATGGGTFRVIASSSSKYDELEGQWEVGGYGASGTLTITKAGTYFGQIITQARISCESGTAGSYLDLYVSDVTGTYGIALWGFGPNCPAFVTPIVVGAVAGSGATKTLTIARGLSTTDQLISSVAIGTAPLVVTSTTEVANLRAATATALASGGNIGANGTAITRIRHGRASAMVAGVIAVADAYVTANTRIMLSVYTTGGTVGFLNTGTRTASTSFTITSSSVLDTSVVDWVAFEP